MAPINAKLSAAAETSSSVTESTFFWSTETTGNFIFYLKLFQLVVCGQVARNLHRPIGLLHTVLKQQYNLIYKF